MTAKPDTVTQFAKAVDLALTLPHPTEIYRAILSGSREVDNGLRGTAYDGDRTSGGTAGSHPERQLERRHPGQFPGDDQPDKPGTWGTSTDRPTDDLAVTWDSEGLGSCGLYVTADFGCVLWEDRQ